jgi:hypothetical protein
MLRDYNPEINLGYSRQGDPVVCLYKHVHFRRNGAIVLVEKKKYFTNYQTRLTFSFPFIVGLLRINLHGCEVHFYACFK